MGTVAIIGAGGVVGAKLVEQALAADDASMVYAFSHGTIPAIPAARSSRVRWAPLDITNAIEVYRALDASQPEVIINAAAMTNVDACETHRDDAEAANGLAPRYLAEVSVRLNARLIHVSTDYVFPGDDLQPGPYLEDAATRPVNHYGWTKLHGEQAVQEICGGRIPWLIVRTALVYGYVPGGRTNFVAWLAGELHAGRRVRVVNDQINTPTVADDLAQALLHLCRVASEGIIHVAGPDLISRDAWARTIAEHYGLDTGLIDVVSTRELHQPAARPLQSGLRTGRGDELRAVPLRGVRLGLGALPAR